MLTVYHLGISQSERIVWLCEELDLTYELVRFDRDPVTGLAPAAYKALHPTGTAPVIRDGEVVLAESGAIIEYLIHRHGQGRLAVEASSARYPDYLFWFHFVNGSLMPVEMLQMVIGAQPSGDGGPLAGVFRKRGEIAWGLLEQRLAASDYLAGETLTAADIIAVFCLTTMRRFVPRDLAGYPHIRRYLQRIGARPAYQRAMAKADPGVAPLLD